MVVPEVLPRWIFSYGSWWIEVLTELSPPLDLSSDFEESIETAFAFFADNIFNRSKRPALFDKEVFIEANEVIEGKPIGFWHFISIENNHKFEVLPCNNDITLEQCNGNCESNKHQISSTMKADKRNICLYRARRLPWILDILKMANRDDPAVKVWYKPDDASNGKLYLRYCKQGNDYVVILANTKKFYRIISAFPVFYKKERKVFDKDYERFKWSYFAR